MNLLTALGPKDGDPWALLNLQPKSTTMKPHLPLALGLSLTLGTLAPVMVSAQQVEPDEPVVDRAASDEREFNKLLRERNALTRKLYDLDRMAARELATGKEPVSIYAQQQAVQDELDQAGFRLQILAMRLGKPLPAPPSEPKSELHGSGDGTNYHANFNRGRERALGVIRQRTRDMLSSLNFADYVEG